MTTIRTLLVGALLYCSSADSLPPEDSTLQKTAAYDLRHGENVESYLAIAGQISEVFRVPMSFEWSYVDEDRSEVDFPRIGFAIHKGESLTSTLDRFCAATEGKLRWDRISGIICLRPAGLKGTTESLLDARVTLQLRDTSTWHAFVELARIVNSLEKSDRFLIPVAMPTDEGNTPPPALREQKTISLNLQDVTAREAACAIMAASPLRMEFWYYNSYRPGLSSPPSARLSLWAYDEQRNLLHGPPVGHVTNREVWGDEALSVVPKPPATTPSTVPKE